MQTHPLCWYRYGRHGYYRSLAATTKSVAVILITELIHLQGANRNSTAESRISNTNIVNSLRLCSCWLQYCSLIVTSCKTPNTKELNGNGQVKVLMPVTLASNIASCCYHGSPRGDVPGLWPTKIWWVNNVHINKINRQHRQQLQFFFFVLLFSIFFFCNR